MTVDKRDLDAARDLMAEVEAELPTLDGLRELYDGLSTLASHVGEATVAILSALPLVSADPRGVGFLADAMDANAAAMRTLLDVQGATSRLLEAQGDRLAGLDNRYQSLRVRIDGAQGA